MVRKFCVVTGSRADYGYLYWLMKEIEDDADCALQILVTGMHLAPEFGLTRGLIETDGFKITETVDMLLASDTSVGIAKSMGLGVIGCAEALARLQPDWVVLLGDRFETFAADQASLILKLPIAHLAGGDVTEGAFDNALRHSITKMATVHFVTNSQAASRVRQLGEDPRLVFNVGSTGLDYIRRVELLTRENLMSALGIQFRETNFLITFHPATLDYVSPEAQLAELIAALDSFDQSKTALIFTGSNADTGGRTLNRMLESYVTARPGAYLFNSLGQQRYLSLIAQVDAVVGNSSSGLYEVPSFKKPTVNIGDRQKGRPRATSVVSCEPNRVAIASAIHKALSLDCSGTVNPYGDGESAPRVFKVLKELGSPEALLRKHFHEL